MVVSRSRYIAGCLGGMLLGVIPAAGLASVVGYLWPIMVLPAFWSTWLAWMVMSFGGILRQEGKWEIRWTRFRETRAWFRQDTKGILSSEFVVVQVGTLLLGGVIAPLIAGGVGIFWPQLRWKVFVGVLAIWTVGVIKSTLSKRHRGTKRAKHWPPLEMQD